MKNINYGFISFTSSIIMGVAIEIIGVFRLQDAYQFPNVHPLMRVSMYVAYFGFILGMVFGLTGLIRRNFVVSNLNTSYSIIGILFGLFKFSILYFGIMLRI